MIDSIESLRHVYKKNVEVLIQLAVLLGFVDAEYRIYHLSVVSISVL